MFLAEKKNRRKMINLDFRCKEKLLKTVTNIINTHHIEGKNSLKIFNPC